MNLLIENIGFITLLISILGIILPLILYYANGINRRFDKIDAKFDKMDAKFDKMEERFEKLYDESNKRWADVLNKFHSLDKDIYQLKTTLISKEII
jgi:predicted PurR-regulated permease PerM